jgi:hypothetical protein
MSTLLSPPPYDPERERRRKRNIVTLIAIVIILAALAFHFRHWRAEHEVSQFFSAIEHNDFEKAYGIWLQDPNWKQHANQHSAYPFDEFYKDWGPGGEWGVVQSYHVDGSTGTGSGVIVVVTVNDRVDPKARIWYEKKDHTLTFSPY